MLAKPVLALIPALVVLAGCEFEDMGDFGRYHEDFHYNYPLKMGGRVTVEGFNGGIEISPWDHENVGIIGTRYVRSQDEISEFKIEVVHSADSVSLRATNPTMRNGNFDAPFFFK